MYRRSMRADMTPEQVRAAGIYLNGGRRRGWKLRLAALLDTPQATISAWSTRSAGNARPIPGVTAHPGQAGDAMAERLRALLGQPQPLAAEERPITVDNLDRPSGSVQRAPLLGIKRPRARPEQLVEPSAEQGPTGSPVPLGIGPRQRGGRPRSSA